MRARRAPASWRSQPCHTYAHTRTRMRMRMHMQHHQPMHAIMFEPSHHRRRPSITSHLPPFILNRPLLFSPAHHPGRGRLPGKSDGRVPVSIVTFPKYRYLQVHGKSKCLNFDIVPRSKAGGPPAFASDRHPKSDLPYRSHALRTATLHSDVRCH